MSNSTNAVNNVNKIQSTQGSGKKTNVDSKDAAPQFEALFSSAIVQLAPNAQLNTIEAQLRESLFKQDNKQKKNHTESNINTEAAQSTLWAQRNWMQNSSVAAAPQAAPENKSNTAQQLAAPTNQTLNKSTADGNKLAISKPAEQQTNNTASESKQLDTTKPTNTTTAQQQESAEASAEVDVTKVTAAGLPANTPRAPSATQDLSAMALTTVDTPSTDPAELAKSNKPAEQLFVNTTMNSEQSATRISSTQGLEDKGVRSQVEAALSNSTVTLRPENTVNNTAANNLTNANAVAAQLAPQIARQFASTAEQEGSQGIQAGQKLMAGNSLQNLTPGAAITAGTNGLNGTSGAQQALIKTPVTQPGFAKEIGQTVQWAIGKNFSTVDIRVNPETFGPMNMRLVQKGQQVQLIIRTQDEASSNLLTQALSGLKEVLGQQGIQLNQVQIQHNNTPTSNSQANDSQPQFDQHNNSGRGGQQSAKGGQVQQEENQLQTIAPATKSQGKLDLFA